MNFIDATVAKVSEGVTLSFEGQKVTVGGEKAKALIDAGYVGKTVVLGIRPEDVHEVGAPAESKHLSDPIAVTVSVYELLGAGVMLYCDCGSSSVSASVNAATPARAGSKIDVVFDVDKLHFFDKDTEQAIAH